MITKTPRSSATEPNQLNKHTFPFSSFKCIAGSKMSSCLHEESGEERCSLSLNSFFISLIFLLLVCLLQTSPSLSEQESLSQIILVPFF